MPIEKVVADGLRRKSSLLFQMGYPKEAKIYKEVSKQDKMPDDFILDVSPEDYEKSTGMSVGLKKAEMGLPAWKNPGVSIEFPYIITEEDWPDEKRDASLYSSLKKFALQPILDAVGVPLNKTTDGKIAFDKNACVGKQFLLLFQMVRDTRTPEEGGTGKSYPKAVSAHPVGTVIESLGI